MNFSIQTTSATEIQTPCLVLPLWQDQSLSDAAQQWNNRLNGLIQSVIDEDDFKATTGATRMLYHSSDDASTCSRILLLGLGKCEDFRRGNGVRPAPVPRAPCAASSVPNSPLRCRSATKNVRFSALETGQGAVEGVLLGLHQYNGFKTDDDTKNQTRIENVTLLAQKARIAKRCKTASSATDHRSSQSQRARLGEFALQ